MPDHINCTNYGGIIKLETGHTFFTIAVEGFNNLLQALVSEGGAMMRRDDYCTYVVFTYNIITSLFVDDDDDDLVAVGDP